MIILTATLVLTGLGQSQARPKSNGALAAKQYLVAKGFYNNMLFSRTRASSRENWIRCAKFFRQAYKKDPYHKKYAPASLLTLGHIHRRMHQLFNEEHDLNESLGYYDDLITLFPKHRLTDDALYWTGIIHAEASKDYKTAALTFARLLAVYPKGDMVPKVARELEKVKKMAAEQKRKADDVARLQPEVLKPTEVKPVVSGTALAKVLSTRHWSTKSYTRVVIETSAPVKYKEILLEPQDDKPRRLYVNVYGSRIDTSVQKAIPIGDGLLQRVRSAQFDPKTVRVVLDTESLANYKIFSLANPDRIVIDVKGEETAARPETVAAPLPPMEQVDVPDAPSLAQQLGLGIKRVVIDPGHGGKDPGASGIGGLVEKDIVLTVAKKLARKLSKELGCEVILTRKRDIFVPLVERTAIANTKEGDLFISIHANSAPTPKAHGIETYYLDLAETKEASRVAALENATSSLKISELQDILTLVQDSKREELAKLADIVQTSLVNGLSKRYTNIGSYGVKKAPFVVLIGAQMPAILAEIAFLSNPTDARRLKSEAFLTAVADRLAAGIIEYATVLNMASLSLSVTD